MLGNHWTKNGWNNTVNSKDVKIIEEYLRTINGLQYIGHGGTCISFKSDDKRFKNTVIKVCLKNNDVMSHSKMFIDYSVILKDNCIKILEPLEILYENSLFFIYTQYKCKPICEINIGYLIKILSIIKKLLCAKTKIPDLYIKNF